MSIANDYFGFHKQLMQQGIILSFAGYLSEDILFSLGQALKQKMALEAADANVIKRVFAVFVEQVQNVIRYSADRLEGDFGKPVELSSGLVAVGHEHGCFFVVCGNVVGHQEGLELCERLRALANMDKEELKAHYRKKLREPPEEDSRGASIGLIEIARRSTRPIEFGFDEFGEDRTYFCLKAYI